MGVSVSDPPAATTVAQAADSSPQAGRRILRPFGVRRLLPWLALPFTTAAGVFLLTHFYKIPSVVDPNPLGIALIVLITGILVACSVAIAYCLLAGAGISRSVGQLYLAVTASTAANYSTPLKAGIPLRVYLYKRLLGISPATGSALLGLEIILATLVPAAISLFALLLFLPEGGPAVAGALTVMVSGAAAALAFIRSRFYDRAIVRLPLPGIARRALAPSGDIVVALRDVPLGSLGAAAGIFAAMFVLVGVRSFCAFQLFGGSMSVVELVGISAAAFTLGSLSLLPMGLGVRDATLVALFAQAGADRDVAIAVAALDRLLSTGVPLLLGILSAQILGLRAIPGPASQATRSIAAAGPERAGMARGRAGVRLGTFYRSVLTSALWPTNGTASRTLDVGCHNGFWLHQQAPGCGARVGCDLTPVALYSNIHYVKCDGRSLPFASGAFELCTAWDVLEHVSDDRALLGELSRVLQPGGRVRLSVPHKQIAVFPVPAMPWLHRRWQHSLRTGYTPSEIRSLAEASGFAKCTIIALEAPWFRSLYLVASLVWGLWPAAGRRLVTALARGDAAAGWGPKGVVLVELQKQLAEAPGGPVARRPEAEVSSTR
jgi:uncharacterized membrane protein YbhN (UPF0104 family)/SAM-dependent methyltransferase